jgi:hypothetical protein
VTGSWRAVLAFFFGEANVIRGVPIGDDHYFSAAVDELMRSARTGGHAASNH